MAPPTTIPRQKSRAFTLVETALAAGIVAFAVIPVLGLVATGITSAKDSTTNLAISNIVRSLRADSQANTSTLFDVTATTSQTHYFTAEGYPTSEDKSTNAFYQVDLNWSAPSSSATNSASARVVSATILYPYPAKTQSSVTSFFVAQ